MLFGRTNNVSKLLEQTFKEMKIEFEYDAEKKAYFAYFALSEDLRGVVQYVVNSHEHLVFNTAYPENVNEEHLLPVCKDLLDINNRALTGSFDVDLSTGRVIFRSTVSLLGNMKPSKEVLREQIELGLYSIEMFHRDVWMKHCPPRSSDPMIG